MSTSKTRQVLAANLRKLIDADAQVGVQSSVRRFAMSRDLEVRLVDRLIKGEHSPTLDILDRVAEACGVQTWQLLSEDFAPPQPGGDAARPPELSAADRELLARLSRLLGSSLN